MIQFQNQDDADFLYNYLQKYYGFYSKVEKNQSRLLVELKDGNREESLGHIHQGIKRLILDKKRPEWWKHILQEEFFYTDEDEQQQIIDMVHFILEGKRKDLSVNIDYEQDERAMDEAIRELLSSSSPFSFEAFITFRLRSYLEKISSLIEIAIDEYKLEQDYQMFIHYLRKFIHRRTPEMKEVHIVNNDGFIFFDEKNQEMKRNELNKRIDRKLLSHHPIYVDSNTIAPLISINPEKILLYTDTPDQGIIHTLKQVFDERICIYPLNSFKNIGQFLSPND